MRNGIKIFRIKELRQAKKYSQKQVADILGTTQQVYSRYENGANALPIIHLISLSKLYGVTTDYILGLDRGV